LCEKLLAANDKKIYRTYTLKENEEIFHVVLGLVYVV
jgi:hypothetical protein